MAEPPDAHGQKQGQNHGGLLMEASLSYSLAHMLLNSPDLEDGRRSQLEEAARWAVYSANNYQQSNSLIGFHHSRYMEGAALLELGDPQGLTILEETLEHMKQLQLNQARARGLVLVARHHMGQREWERSHAILEEVNRQLDQPSATVTRLRARTLYELGRYEEAVAVLDHYPEEPTQAMREERRVYQRCANGEPHEALPIYPVTLRKL